MTDHRKQNKYIKLLRDTGQLTEHYKMYKSGKNWLFAGISLLTFGAGVAANQSFAKADTVTANDKNETEATTSTTSVNSNSTVTLKAASTTSTASDMAASEGSSDNATVSSNAATSSTSDLAVTQSTNTTTQTNSTATDGGVNLSSNDTSTSSNDVADISTVSDSAAVVATAKEDTTKLTELQTQLPTGTTIATQSDGSTLIELPVGADIDLVKQILTASDLQGAITVTAKDADALTGPKTYAGGATSGNDFNDAMNAIANAVTMADFEWITAVGTGTLNGKAATLAEINSYFKNLYDTNKSNYHLLGTLTTFTGSNVAVATQATEANAAAFDYYYFLGAQNSYVDGLVSYLQNLSTADLAKLAQQSYDNSTNMDVNALLSQASPYVFATFYPAATSAPVTTVGGTPFTNPTATVTAANTGGNYWKIPFVNQVDTSDKNSNPVINFSNFVNSVVSLYIGAIVPGAEKFVIQSVLPAINTISDTKALTDYTNLNSILNQIGANAYQTTKSLMTLDGTFDLTSIVSHIEMLYQDAKIAFPAMNLGNLGKYVGAFESSPETLTYNKDTLTGNAVGFKNFSLFNSLYVAYAEAIVKVLYGSAMLGKFEAIQGMYNNTTQFVNYMSGKKPTDIKLADFESSVLGVTNSTNTFTQATQLTTFQQGVWDVYNYIYPYYKAGLEDKDAGTVITDTKDDAYLNATFARANKVLALKDTTGTAITLDLTTDDAGTVDPNPHKVSNFASAQTAAYLASFYSSAVNSTTAEQVVYQIQPVIRTIIKDESGNVLKTVDTNIGKATGDLQGKAGNVVQATDLPAVTGYPTPAQTDLVKWKVYVPENGGLLNVPYAVKEQTAGPVAVDFVNANTNSTYDVKIAYANGVMVENTTGQKTVDKTFTLDTGQILTITVRTGDTAYKVKDSSGKLVDSATFTVPFEESGGTLTVEFTTAAVAYTIQPVVQTGTDATTGTPTYKNIGTAITGLSGTAGTDINTTKLTTITGYTKPTYANSAAIPDIPTNGGIVQVVYTVKAEQVQVKQTGAPTGTTFTYSVNGATAKTGTYDASGTAKIDAKFGDKIVITPKAVTGYTLSGTDTSVATKTITVGENAANSSGVVTISDNNTANFVYAARNVTLQVIGTNALDGTTFSYVINGTTKGTGTFKGGKATIPNTNVHFGDTVVITAGAQTGFSVDPVSKTLTINQLNTVDTSTPPQITAFAASNIVTFVYTPTTTKISINYKNSLGVVVGTSTVTADIGTAVDLTTFVNDGFATLPQATVYQSSNGYIDHSVTLPYKLATGQTFAGINTSTTHAIDVNVLSPVVLSVNMKSSGGSDTIWNVVGYGDKGTFDTATGNSGVDFSDFINTTDANGNPTTLEVDQYGGQIGIWGYEDDAYDLTKLKFIIPKRSADDTNPNAGQTASIVTKDSVISLNTPMGLTGNIKTVPVTGILMADYDYFVVGDKIQSNIGGVTQSSTVGTIASAGDAGATLYATATASIPLASLEVADPYKLQFKVYLPDGSTIDSENGTGEYPAVAGTVGGNSKTDYPTFYELWGVAGDDTNVDTVVADYITALESQYPGTTFKLSDESQTNVAKFGKFDASYEGATVDSSGGKWAVVPLFFVATTTIKAQFVDVITKKKLEDPFDLDATATATKDTDSDNLVTLTHSELVDLLAGKTVANYKLADDTTISYSLDQADVVEIPLVRDAYTPIDPGTEPGTEATYLTGTVTSKIEYGAAGSTAAHTVDGTPVSIYRTVEVDAKGNPVSYTPWTTNESGIAADADEVIVGPINESDIIPVAGYTGSIVAEKNSPITTSATELSDGDSNQATNTFTITREIVYAADDQKLDVSYVDDDNNSNVVATDTITGVTDETGTYTANKIPTNYELADDQLSTVDYTLTTDNSVPIIIHLKHVMSEPIVPTDPKDPNYPETHKTITRDISYNGVALDSLTDAQKKALGEDGLNQLKNGVTQNTAYTRTVIIDQVTNHPSYGSWTTNDGFTAVTSPKVLGYTADKDAAAVTLDDAAVTNFEAQSSDVTVTYSKDATVTVEPTDPKDPTDPVDPSDPDGPKYPSGVSESDLNKTVSRTITYTGADQNPASVTQTGSYTRSATVDAKTGELLEYGAWTLTANSDTDTTNDGFTAVTSPKVLGYTVDKDAAAVTLDDAAVTNFEAQSSDVTVTYSKDATVTVEPTDPKDPTDPVDPSDPDGPKYPSGVSESDLNKTVSRTITYKVNTSDDPNMPAAPATVTQTTNYKRSAIVDTQIGEILRYTDWIIDGTNGLVPVESPVLDNYQANPTSVVGVTLTSNDINAIRSGEKNASFGQTVSYTFTGKVTTTKDPDGGTTTVTKDPNGEITDINKTWPDGDKTHVHVDPNTGVETVTETPNGKPALPTVTVKPGDSVTVGKTTVHNDKPDGVVSMTHEGDNTSEGQLVVTVHPDGSITYSYIKTVIPTATAVKAEVVPQLTQPKHGIAQQVQTTKKLPQTDEQNETASAVVGMSLLGMILGWVGFKRKKRDED